MTYKKFAHGLTSAIEGCEQLLSDISVYDGDGVPLGSVLLSDRIITETKRYIEFLMKAQDILNYRVLYPPDTHQP